VESMPSNSATASSESLKLLEVLQEGVYGVYSVKRVKVTGRYMHQVNFLYDRYPRIVLIAQVKGSQSICCQTCSWYDVS
jgi:hypothetical protein